MIVQEHKKGEKISCTNEMEEKKRGCYNGSIKSKEAAAPQKKVQRLFLFSRQMPKCRRDGGALYEYQR